MVVFGHDLLYSGRVDVIGKSGCVLTKWLYSSKVVVFARGDLDLAKVIVFVKKWLYSGNVVV